MTASPGAESPAPGGEGATKEDVDLASHTFSTSAQDAIDKAVEEAGGGFVHTIELDWSSDTSAWVYEVEVLDGTTEYDIDVHADTGEVLDVDSGSTDDVEGAIDLSSPMTWETARDKALEAVRGPVTSWKLEYDDDGMEYVFEIDGSSDDDVDVKIDVNSGEVEIDD